MTNITSVKFSLESELKNIVNKDIQYTVPIFIPHLGCPNECVFCNQRKISGNNKVPSIEEIEEFVSERIKNFKVNKKVQIAFFGGSFTGIDILEQEKYLKFANKYIEEGKVSSIRISTRPDYISKEILEMLKKYHVETIELGVQSMDEEVLKASKRGHTASDVIKAANLINSYGIELGFQIMIGLPKSNLEKELHTINKLLEYKPKQLRIYPVYVLKESELWDMYEEGKYIPITVKEARERCAKIILECNKSDVQIIRIGLQSTDEICAKNASIVGPVSDNFADYAISKIALDKIEKECIKKVNRSDDKYVLDVLELITSSRYFSYIIGPKGENKTYLRQKYGIGIKLKPEAN